MSEILKKYISHHLIFFPLIYSFIHITSQSQGPLSSQCPLSWPLLPFPPPFYLPGNQPTLTPWSHCPESLPWLLLAWGSCSANWAVLPETQWERMSPNFTKVFRCSYSHVYLSWAEICVRNLTNILNRIFIERQRKIYPWVTDREQSRGLVCTVQSSHYPHCGDFINVTAPSRRKSPQQRAESHDWMINYTSFFLSIFQTEGKINFLTCLLVSFVVGFQRVTRMP